MGVMHLNCLPSDVRGLLKDLSGIVHAHDFILAGDTALALQLGHRLSVDLDFFTARPFSTEGIFSELRRLGLDPVVLEESTGSLTVTLNKAKVSMFHYPYPFTSKEKEIKGIPVAGIIDIASMKVIAISQRGAKRDFVDLYFVLQDIPFRKVAENMIERFGRGRINSVHIGKSLVFFNDADSDPEPRYAGTENPDWEDVKTFFTNNVQQMVLDMDKAGK